MVPSYKNQLMQSFLLWMDHTLLDDGRAYTNRSSLFYNIEDSFVGLNTYAGPFQQLVADSSVDGATVLSGLWVDGTFSQTGENGFHEFNYDKAQAYFTTNEDQSTISGDYAVKTFSIFHSDFDEATLLFETKDWLNNRFALQGTGIPEGAVTYPSIMIKAISHNNEEWAFGGTDRELESIRAVVLADNKYELDATLGLFEEQIRRYVPLLSQSENPFNFLGGLRSGEYNYETLTANKTVGSSDTAFINNVTTSKFGGNTFTRNLQETLFNNQVHIGIIDFELESIRLT